MKKVFIAALGIILILFIIVGLIKTNDNKETNIKTVEAVDVQHQQKTKREKQIPKTQQEPIKQSNIVLDVPMINQLPELPRGCEVTSLAMMLQFAGVNVDKMTLASQIIKDTTPYEVIDGIKYFGNPHDGFVGDMYTFNKPGYGVYHEPVKELAEKYLPGRIVDISGLDFEEVLNFLQSGKPVWVVNNVLFDTVPEQYWMTWKTPSGEIKITMKEHSVLVTGFDSNYIYFNDPLKGEKNRKVAIANFKRGWEQMGSQAISYK